MPFSQKFIPPNLGSNLGTTLYFSQDDNFTHCDMNECDGLLYHRKKNPTDSEFWQNPVKVLFFFCLKHPYQEIFNEFIFDYSILLHMCSNFYYITPYILCRILINLCVLCYEFKQWCACMSTPLKITQQCRKYALMRRTSKWQSIQNRDCPKK